MVNRYVARNEETVHFVILGEVNACDVPVNDIGVDGHDHS